MSFEIGDRVTTQFGQGRIICIKGKYSILVEHDKNMEGHNGQSSTPSITGKNGHCWWCRPSNLTKINNTPHTWEYKPKKK